MDSRGDPTVEATVEAGEHSAKAKVPSGASTGKSEALELRDNDPSRYNGKGVLNAVQNVNGEISNALKGMDVERISLIDQRLIDLDGAENKGRLGANAILGVSLACARLASQINQAPLYKYIRDYYNFSGNYKMPVPLANLLNGGLHAASSLDWQELWAIPVGIGTFKERTRAVSEIFHVLGKILTENKLDTDLGNEGGYAPNFESIEQAWEILSQAIVKAGYKLGSQIFLGLDAGASVFYDAQNQLYVLKRANKTYTSAELALVYEQWLAKLPILAFEDPFSEEDWGAWQSFNLKLKAINPKILLIGDDLFTTNAKRLIIGIQQQAANAVLIKPNQIGTLLETINCVKLAQENHFKIAVSHRSGETEDDFIADLAVAVGADYVKVGSTARSERIVKYNRLMEIERELFL